MFFDKELVMSNDNKYERLWKLQARINMLILDGHRDPEQVADMYQDILEQPSAACSAQKWREENNVVYFSVTSRGTTGEGWIERFERKFYRYGECAEHVLRSPHFKSTNGVTTRVAILKNMHVRVGNPNTKEICTEAGMRKLSTPAPELACLIREKFTDREIKVMGLTRIVVMHEPINDRYGDPRLLYANRHDGGRRLDAYRSMPAEGWPQGVGFAFAIPQDSPQG